VFKRIHLLVLALKQTNPVYNFPPYFFKIHFNIIPPPIPRSFCRFPHHNPAKNFLLFHSNQTLHPPLPPRFTRQELQVMKFHSVQFCPASCLSVPNMLLGTLFLNNSVYVLPSVGDPQLMTKHKRRQESWGRLITKWNDGHLVGLWYQLNQRGGNTILNDRRNGRRVPYINEARQITQV